MFKALLSLVRREETSIELDESLWSPSGWSQAAGGDERSMFPKYEGVVANDNERESLGQAA